MNVGPDGSTKNAVGQTRRNLSLTTAVAALATDVQKHRVQSCLGMISTKGSNALGLVVVRNYDATPCQVEFGRWAGLVAPYARYFVKDSEAAGGRVKWLSVDFAEYTQRCPAGKGRRQHPHKGTLELLAQTMSMHYGMRRIPGEPLEWYDRDIVLPPVFLARADASCTARAHDFTPLGLKEFLALAAVLDFFVLSDVPDNAAPNLRYQAWLVTQLPRNVFLHFAGCAVHTAHRIVAGAVQEKRLVGDAYSIHFIIVQPKIYSILLRALRSNPRQPKHDVHNSQSSKVAKIINS